MRWNEFAQQCPSLAQLIRDRFKREQIFLLGTLRPGGAPRISGVECDFVGDDLMAGMIWRSTKALDLRRDRRFTIHSLVPDKAHESENQGDIKLSGQAVEITDKDHKQRYEAVLEARINWRPPEPYHCFAFDLERAGMVRFRDGGRDVLSWRAGHGLHERRVPDVPDE
ncbi:MAG: hypothetical protein ACRDTQ_02990 [Micromonosporaceae bacterium]